MLNPETAEIMENLRQDTWMSADGRNYDTNAEKSGGHEEHKFLSASNPPVEVAITLMSQGSPVCACTRGHKLFGLYLHVACETRHH
jgi:hypothetical protein